jgi:hypothetical protein
MLLAQLDILVQLDLPALLALVLPIKARLLPHLLFQVIQVHTAGLLVTRILR